VRVKLLEAAHDVALALRRLVACSVLDGFLVHVTASRISSNVVPRSAVDGQLMDVHDGTIDQ
jgi:hypothetical protein